MNRSPRLLPIVLLIGATTGCATLREHPQACRAGASLLGATLGGVGGGVGVHNIEKSPDNGERAAGAGAGFVAGGLVGYLVGRAACPDEPPPPPPPVAVAPPRPAPGVKIVELKSAHFDFNKSELKPAGKSRVDEAVRVMRQSPDLRVSIEGHTDSVGSDAYNQKLGLRRATTVKNYLMQQGISSGRTDVRSFGESKPVASNTTSDGRAENRRVEIIAE